METITLDKRLYSAGMMLFIVCLAIVGIYLLLMLFSMGMEPRYRFFVNNSEARAVDMASLQESIEPYFPSMVSVRVYNSANVLLETLWVTPIDLQAPVPAGLLPNFERGDVYSRLKMYAQPDKLDVLFRWIYVDKETFSNFITNLILFETEALKDSAKAVFLR